MESSLSPKGRKKAESQSSLLPKIVTIKSPLLNQVIKDTDILEEGKRTLTPKTIRTLPTLTSLNKSVNLKNEEKIINFGKFTKNEISYKKTGSVTSLNQNKNLSDDNLKKSQRQSIFNQKTPKSKCPFDMLIRHKKNESLKGVQQEIEEKSPSKSTTKSHILSKINFPMLVLDFKEKILKLPQISKYFQNKDIAKAFLNMMEFFQNNYGKSDQKNAFVYLESIHRKMEISNDDFNVFKGFFSISFREHKVDEEITADFLKYIESFRKFIVYDPFIFMNAKKEIPDFEDSLIEKFMEKLNSNHVICNFFNSKSATFQKSHCKEVVLFLLRHDTGNENYKESMREIHKDCLISDHIFYHFKQCFLTSLKEFKVKVDINSNSLFSPYLKAGKKETSYFDERSLYEIGDVLETLRIPIMNHKTYYEILKERGEYENIQEYFINLVSTKPSLRSLFKYSEDKLTRHMKNFLLFILNGPTKYTKFDITPAHYNLGITLQQYDEMRNALKDSLEKFNLDQNEVTYILCELDYYKYNLCNEMPLIKRIGGNQTIQYIVHSFYLKAFSHCNLNGFFKNTDIKTMINNQTYWFCKFFDHDGMRSYNYKDLRAFHLGMGITEEAYNFFIQTFIDGFKEMDITDKAIIDEVIQHLEKTKRDVLDK